MNQHVLFGLLALSLSCHTSYEADPLDDAARCLGSSCPPGVVIKAQAPRREATPSDGRFVVHEWGTFTTLVDEDGQTFTWYPLLASKPLPRFVSAQWFQTLSGEWHWGKGWDFSQSTAPIQGTVRMETPVLYFYSEKERELSVEVKFNDGYLTEWFPHAAVPIQNPNTIKWPSVRLTPGAKEEFLTEAEGSEYYAARETDATPLRSVPPPVSWPAGFDKAQPLPKVPEMIAPPHEGSGVQTEKFLFYRGVGSFEVPLSAALVTSNDDEQRLVVRNQQGEYIPGMILFYRAGDKVWFQVQDGLDKGESRPLSVSLATSASDIEAVKEALVSLLEAQHLYGREAKAMVKTWEEAWFEEGLRVFYIVPRETTDNILPLTLSEQPEELERVLVGRIDLLTPGQRQEITAALQAALQSQSAPKKVAQLLTHGRFVQPVLAALQSKATPAEKPALDALFLAIAQSR